MTMHLDLETFLTALYVIVEDLYQSHILSVVNAVHNTLNLYLIGETLDRGHRFVHVNLLCLSLSIASTTACQA
jgi:hypothetical protein